ncbi:esterase [Marinobacter sp. NP-4(2019)]|uniref:lipase family alpha/beta hydrolase n=1 Tax=Marinobacter sp. NP-4(2019) TaxID=2488665 RepID=UPI000FC3CD69|nr:esterase [Marinobacter sp. NP-4(2019)]AZT85474.1 esterase [Marinobacter sp. NP-4(2019)]
MAAWSDYNPLVFRREKEKTLRPSRLLLALEGRALLELATLPLAMPWLLRRVPRGDGHAVLVIPGFLASDISTVPLRRFLRNRGYQVHGWEQGRNFGPKAGLMEQMVERLEQLHTDTNTRVSLIGWSLGGIFAREIARAKPHLVRQVITMGSPLYGAPETSTHAWHLYKRLNRYGDEGLVRGDKAPPVPTTSVFSRGDGIVGWEGSVERCGAQTENVEVNCASHLGLGVNPVVWTVLGDRLAQGETEWTPFRVRGAGKA